MSDIVKAMGHENATNEAWRRIAQIEQQVQVLASELAAMRSDFLMSMRDKVR